MNLRRLFSFSKSSAVTSSTAPAGSTLAASSIANLVNTTILDSAGVTEGQWIDVGRFILPFSIVVHGFNEGDAVQIFVSNQASIPALKPPAPGDGSVAYGAQSITTDTVVPVNHAIRWIRCRKSNAANTPAITVAMLSGMAYN